MCKNFYLNVIFQIGNGEIDKKRNDLQNKVFQIQPHWYFKKVPVSNACCAVLHVFWNVNKDGGQLQTIPIKEVNKIAWFYLLIVLPDYQNTFD